ncbi:MAG: carboxylesterase [Xanthomonadales bacterium]|nr:carboxylesterase [Xanthomonadales bacterium]
MDAIQLDTGPSPTAAVVWLHGLGADGHDFEPVVPQLHWDHAPPMRFIFPHAPHQPVTINAGMVMRAWYDIPSLDFEKRVDEEGIRRSAESVEGLLDQLQRDGIPSHRTVLAGFSQGGAVALHLGLRRSEALAGIIALSCAMPLPQALATERSEASRATPVWVGHGQFDDVVPVGLGELSAGRLNDWGYRVTWHQYPVAHGVTPEEVADIRGFLMEILSTP